jgi:3-hydroxyacyl-CoA dehydrogenase
VACIRLQHPPVNVLSVRAGVVEALVRQIKAALADRTVATLVVGAAGKLFCAGADLADFDRADFDRAGFDRPIAVLEQLRALMSDVVEQADKPIVMAVHGAALGGGLELALAGHYRICAPGTLLGLPEVTLGLLPGSGGTQRLPRLIGVQAALNLMLTGKPIEARRALQLGLVDRIATSNLQAEAVQWALTLGSAPPRRVSQLPLASPDAPALTAARHRLSANALSQAPALIIDCVEAASAGSFSAGMAIERRLFETLLGSDASRGLRHVFLGQRELARLTEAPPASAPRAATPAAAPIRSVAIIGAGRMGTGIAIALLNASLPVTLIEPHTPALTQAITTVRDTLERAVQKGRITTATAAQRLALLSTSARMDDIADADLIIEAVYESMELKRQVFAQMDGLAKPSAVFASNTSTLDLNAMAAVTAHPQRVLGLHFFSPAHVMKLLEIVRGEHTDAHTLWRARRFARDIGKVAVVCGVCDGFIGNRMYEEYKRQTYQLLEEGALPAQIDGALERFGMAMGPLKATDLSGQDIGWSTRKRRAIEQPDRPYSRIPDLLCEMGRFGQKTGAGFYLYADGRTPQVDPAIDALILRYCAQQGIQRRAICDEEIVERCVLALINEGARILGEGIASRALDVDMVYVFGYGFPAERGGPMSASNAGRTAGPGGPHPG